MAGAQLRDVGGGAGKEDPGSSRVVCTASFSEDTLKKEKQAAYTDTYLVSEANGKSKSDRCPLWPFRLSLICLPRPQTSACGPDQ